MPRDWLFVVKLLKDSCDNHIVFSKDAVEHVSLQEILSPYPSWLSKRNVLSAN